MKRILVVAVVFFLASTLLYAPSTRGKISTLGNTLVVCVGAHPDDIEIAISGSLYKNEIGKQPILWLIVTDGGADIDEYQYETNVSRNWLAKDGQVAVTWKAPDGSNVTRQFYSADLAKKRCGGYFDGLNWKEEAALHNSTFGVEYDWRTRVNNFVGATIGKSQLGYLEPGNSTKQLMYPDGALANAESAFTNSIAENLASEIDTFAESHGYQKSLMKIYSHAPEEVCMNSNEHPDHRVTGNAVRQAIDLLHLTYGFGQIDAKWYTIYNPIDPKSGYLRIDEDISPQQTQKSELAKACWETDYVHSRSINYTWNDYPDDPGHYEYFIAQSYYARTTATIFSLSPNPAVVGQTVALLGNLTGNGQTLNNTRVSMYVGGGFLAYLYTNASGWFIASAMVNSPGTFIVNVTYAGNETYNPSSHIETLTVYQTMPTNVTFTLSPNPVKVGQTVTLKGNLTDIGGTPIGNALLELWVKVGAGSWQYMASLSTNSTGWVQASGTILSAGTYQVAVVYRGTSQYGMSYKIETLTVNP